MLNSKKAGWIFASMLALAPLVANAQATGAGRVENGPPFAAPVEVGVGARSAEAVVVGGGDDVTGVEQRRQRRDRPGTGP